MFPCRRLRSVLQADFNVAKGSTKRPRRESVDYSTSYAKPRSPLVMIEFWRCVMDEVGSWFILISRSLLTSVCRSTGPAPG